MEINKSYHSDNKYILANLPDKSVSLFLEDMPYNTTQSHFEYDVDLVTYWANRIPKLKDNGVFALFADEPFTSRLIQSNLEMFIIRITWDKETDRNILNAYKMPLKRTEDIVIFSPAKVGSFTYNPVLTPKERENIRPRKTGKTIQKQSCYGTAKGLSAEQWQEDKKMPSNLVSFSAAAGNCNSVNRIHVNQKPVELLRYIIQLFTNKNDLLFDGYAGSGSTAIAAHLESRNYIICEKSEIEYKKQQAFLKSEISPILDFSYA
jgi:site-specific DNA-methyltransferase (adenine-specific)